MCGWCFVVFVVRSDSGGMRGQKETHKMDLRKLDLLEHLLCQTELNTTYLQVLLSYLTDKNGDSRGKIAAEIGERLARYGNRRTISPSTGGASFLNDLYHKCGVGVQNWDFIKQTNNWISEYCQYYKLSDLQLS